MTTTKDNDSAQQPEAADEDALRRRLINRIVLAGAAVVALLGGLAVIDTMYVAPPTPTPKTVTAQSIAETTKPVDAVAIPAVIPTPPVAPEPPKPEAIPSIKKIAEPEETSTPSVARPGQAPAPELAHQEPAHAASHAPAPRPLTQGAQVERRFVLQMGVFNNVENAQELLAKLQKGGVPAQIEARVQVGPFKTRKEAENARAKLEAMGLDAGLLMAIHH